MIAADAQTNGIIFMQVAYQLLVDGIQIDHSIFSQNS